MTTLLLPSARDEAELLENLRPACEGFYDGCQEHATVALVNACCGESVIYCSRCSVSAAFYLSVHFDSGWEVECSRCDAPLAPPMLVIQPL